MGSEDGKSIFGAMRRYSAQAAQQDARVAAEDYQNYLRDLDEAGYEIDPETRKPRKKVGKKQSPAIVNYE